MLDRCVKASGDISVNDLEVEWFSGTGKGGQKRNKVKSCCKLKHIPTGLIQRSQMRQREQSYKSAYDALTIMVQSMYQSITDTEYNEVRKSQSGSGQRGEKRRTYKLHKDVIIDHQSNMKFPCNHFFTQGPIIFWPPTTIQD